MSEQIVFNRSVLGFLKQQNYTHIFNHGIIPGTDNYLLEPLRFDGSEASSKIGDSVEEINSNDVFDMADGDEFITFLIEISDKEVQLYKASLT